MKLSGWSKSRRLVILRRRIADKEGTVLVLDEANEPLTFLDDAINATDPLNLYQFHIAALCQFTSAGDMEALIVSVRFEPYLR